MKANLQRWLWRPIYEGDGSGQFREMAMEAHLQRWSLTLIYEGSSGD